MQKRGLILLALAFGGVLVLSGCADKRGAAKDALSVAIRTGAAKPPRIVYLMAGKIEANEKADVTSRINARVAAISVDVGAAVKQGQPLIRLDAKDLVAQVAQAQAGVSTARANLNKVLSGARPEQVSQARAALDGAATNYENAKHTYERNQQLFSGGLIAKSQLEQYQTALAAAEAAYKSAREALDILHKGETPETISIYQSQLKQAQAGLELTKTQLDNGIIVAPISGIVSAKSINPGELAVAGAPLVTIVNSAAVTINAYLPATLSGTIKAGQRVAIRVSELPGREFQGEVAVIDSVIDAKNKNILVKVNFSRQDPSLQPGMFAEIGLIN